MRNKLHIIGLSILSIMSLFAPAGVVYAGNISMTQTCSVQVYIKATVPDSVEKGKTMTMTNFTVQPSNTYGFNVTSSVYYLSATNTSSTTYTQDFYATNPSPTSGHTTYIGYYPNWTLDAAGAAGSSVTIKLIKSVTVIQGYGGSPVTCNFNNATLATIPITAPPPPSPSPSPSPSTKPSTQPTPTKTTKPSSTPTSSSTTPSPSATPTTSPSASPTPQPSDSPTQPVEEVSVIPLNIKVTNSNGKPVESAQVTLDDTKKLITDINGRVTFSNVLTGNHAVLVSYNGHNVTSNIRLTTADVGSVKTIKLPPVSNPFNPLIIGAVAIGTLGAAAATALIVIRRRNAHEVGDGNQPAITIPTIIDGSAVPTVSNAQIQHIPAIAAFETQPATQTPAPWEPASTNMPALGTAETALAAPAPQPTPAVAVTPTDLQAPVSPPAPEPAGQLAPQVKAPPTQTPPAPQTPSASEPTATVPPPAPTTPVPAPQPPTPALPTTPTV